MTRRCGGGALAVREVSDEGRKVGAIDILARKWKGEGGVGVFIIDTVRDMPNFREKCTRIEQE